MKENWGILESVQDWMKRHKKMSSFLHEPMVKSGIIESFNPVNGLVKVKAVRGECLGEIFTGVVCTDFKTRGGEGISIGPEEKTPCLFYVENGKAYVFAFFTEQNKETGSVTGDIGPTQRGEYRLHTRDNVKINILSGEGGGIYMIEVGDGIMMMMHPGDNLYKLHAKNIEISSAAGSIIHEKINVAEGSRETHTRKDNLGSLIDIFNVSPTVYMSRVYTSLLSPLKAVISSVVSRLGDFKTHLFNQSILANLKMTFGSNSLITEESPGAKIEYKLETGQGVSADTDLLGDFTLKNFNTGKDVCLLKIKQTGEIIIKNNLLQAEININPLGTINIKNPASDIKMDYLGNISLTGTSITLQGGKINLGATGGLGNARKFDKVIVFHEGVKSGFIVGGSSIVSSI